MTSRRPPAPGIFRGPDRRHSQLSEAITKSRRFDRQPGTEFDHSSSCGGAFGATELA